MSPRLTDQAVSELPLAAARAELLEQIMSTALTERSDVQHEDGPQRGRRWVATIAAAAAAAALVAVPSWLLSRDEPAPVFAGAPTHDWVVLDAPGWSVSYVSDPGEGESEVEWQMGDASLSVNLRDADLRDSYVEDRQRIDHPKVDPGAAVELLGQAALMWAYSPDDHTTIGPVEGGVYPEVRGQGMGKEAYVALLGRLAWTDQAGFESALPEEFVRTGEADETIATMLRGIRLAPGADVPSSGENDPYQLGADVARQVVCPWIAEFARAREAGDSRAVEDAQRALAATQSWAFLNAMNAEGDYPEVVWEMSADVNAGRVPPGYRQGLGCD